MCEKRWEDHVDRMSEDDIVANVKFSVYRRNSKRVRGRRGVIGRRGVRGRRGVKRKGLIEF